MSHYQYCAKSKETATKKLLTDLKKSRSVNIPCSDRFAVKENTIKLAPNRFNMTGHNLANIIYRQTGTKGPYACFSGSDYSL